MSELEKLREENRRLREELRKWEEAHVKLLELQFELSDDDGAAYHDWQDAKERLKRKYTD